MQKLIYGLLTFALLAHPTIAQQERQLETDVNIIKKRCLDFVAAVFLAPDSEVVENLVSRDAVRKFGKPGSGLSIVKEVKSKGEEIATATELKAIHLFDKQQLAAMQEKFPNLEFLRGDRLPKHLDHGIACLVVFRHLEQERTYKSVFVFEPKDDSYKIVYVDDEP